MAATRSVGVRELKTQASRILREVIDRGESVDVTHRGRTIARIVPVAAPSPDEREQDRVWTDLDRLAAEIATRWPAGATAVDAVREGRREL
ncbi:MAG: type II toxin-antitoxin system Phd/YefM family antitoxin [Dehalococcoidia bacterium]